MIRGLYTSSLGMTTQMKRMDVITNNIANADTTGFKRDVAVTQSFSEELMKRLNDPASQVPKKAVEVGKVSQGVFVDTVQTDFSSGTFRNTGGTYDLAIEGSGFFAISVTDADGKESEKYSRDGAFTINSLGQLMTKEGNFAIGENGRIVIPNGQVSISETGEIKVNEERIDQIKMMDFENPDSLRKAGNNLYNTTEETKQTPFTSRVQQGFVENSNINSVKEMVEMITASRVYEANQKIITMIDTTFGQAVSEIGRKQ